MTDAFESLKRGLEDAIDFANGDESKALIHKIDVPLHDVATIRKKSGLTQIMFAMNIGVSVATLRGWEQGRREPRGPARILLALIAKKPSIVQDELKNIVS